MFSRCFSRTCKSGKLTCIVKEVIQENKRKTYIEIWNQCGLFKNFDVNAFDVHGDIYCDGKIQFKFFVIYYIS